LGVYKYNPKFLLAAFQDRVVEGSLLNKQHMVIPVKEGGKIYGTLSNQFVSMYPTIEIPDVGFREARLCQISKEDKRTVTFVGYWNETSQYTPEHMAIVAGRAMTEFSVECTKLRKEWDMGPAPWLLSMPLFKGAEKSADYVAVIESELTDRYDTLCTAAVIPCDVEIVVRDKARVPDYL